MGKLSAPVKACVHKACHCRPQLESTHLLLLGNGTQEDENRFVPPSPLTCSTLSALPSCAWGDS